LRNTRSGAGGLSLYSEYLKTSRVSGQVTNCLLLVT
jgi:hypothetical protein